MSILDDGVVAETEPGDPSGGGRRALPLLWLAVGALLIAAVVGAVLLGGDDRSPAERVAAAPDAVADSGSYAFEITIAADLGAVSNSFSLTGAVDTEASLSKASFDLGGQGLTMVTKGTTLYVQVPEAGRAATGGKAWARLEIDDLLPGAGALGSSTDPSSSFDTLRKLGAEVTDAGAEEVRGTSTRHFRTVLDLTDQLAELGADPSALAGLQDQLADVPVDVWLDGDDRIRRMTTTLDVGGAALGTGKVVTTVEAYDYGKAVSIDVPTADEVFEGDASSLGSLLGGLGS